MELGATADRRTPLTAGDRQPGSLSITGAPKGPPNAYGPPGGAPWGAPQYPYNTECRTGYQVTYEGELQRQQRRSQWLSFSLLLLLIGGIGGLYLISYATSSSEEPTKLSPQCEISQGAECSSYGFPSFFSKERVRLVDASPQKNTFLFRSPLPIAPGGQALTDAELLEAMKAQAQLSGLKLPEKFRLRVISLIWDGYSAILNERCELNREVCLLEKNPSLVASFEQWPLYGESVNPYDVPETNRIALANDFSRWSGDFIDQRVDALYAHLHLGVAAEPAAHAAAAAAAASVAVHPDTAAPALSAAAAEAAAAANLSAAAAAAAGKHGHDCGKEDCRRMRHKPHQQQQQNQQHGQGAAAPGEDEVSGGQQQGAQQLDQHTKKQHMHGKQQELQQQQGEASGGGGAAPEDAQFSQVGIKENHKVKRAKQQQQQQQAEQQQQEKRREQHLKRLKRKQKKDRENSPSAAAAAAVDFEAAAAASSIWESSGSSSDGGKAAVVLVHCYHGRDRTGLLIGAYKMKYLRFSLADVWKDNRVFGMELFESINALMWYCLYLEKGLGLTTPKCFNVYATGIGSPDIVSNGQGLRDIPWPASTPPKKQQPQQQQQQQPGEQPRQLPQPQPQDKQQLQQQQEQPQPLQLQQQKGSLTQDVQQQPQQAHQSEVERKLGQQQPAEKRDLLQQQQQQGPQQQQPDKQAVSGAQPAASQKLPPQETISGASGGDERAAAGTAAAAEAARAAAAGLGAHSHSDHGDACPHCSTSCMHKCQGHKTATPPATPTPPVTPTDTHHKDTEAAAAGHHVQTPHRYGPAAGKEEA